MPQEKFVENADCIATSQIPNLDDETRMLEIQTLVYIATTDGKNGSEIVDWQLENVDGGMSDEKAYHTIMNLVELGIINQYPSPFDGRKTIYDLSDEGKETVEYLIDELDLEKMDNIQFK